MAQEAEGAEVVQVNMAVVPEERLEAGMGEGRVVVWPGG